jgi:hypothetical protein
MPDMGYNAHAHLRRNRGMTDQPWPPDEPAEDPATGSRVVPVAAPGSPATERQLTERVPWLRLEQVLGAAARTAERVLSAGSDREARAAVLPELGAALGFDWAVLWWPDSSRTPTEPEDGHSTSLVAAETWRSPRL